MVSVPIQLLIVIGANICFFYLKEGFFPRLLFFVGSIACWIFLIFRGLDAKRKDYVGRTKEHKLSDAPNYSMFELSCGRKSVRKYDPAKPVEESVIASLKAWCKTDENLVGPFGSKIRIEIVESKEMVNGKVGTYGMISGANVFAVVVKDEKTKTKMLGTFDGKSLKKQLVLNEKESVFMVSPIGYEAEGCVMFSSNVLKASKTFVAVLASRVTGSKLRIPFSKFCLRGSINSTDGVNAYTDVPVIGEALEAAHWAPSSAGKQPTRAVIKEEGGKWVVQFYEAKDVLHNNGVDSGISIGNFDLTLKEKGITGKITIESGVDQNDLYNYTGTWRQD
ncbi:putative nitroreductase Nfs [Blattamonas nauphoetae]|uniref:Nitroreductase Nfs n=1 Tax=Blattamonas nauphoetae TaxID=2049346 RepID=A0ABQ9WM90_9EUKA|nr:putative nitroreductase Nfs [Blattamonas nauphoetae]